MRCKHALALALCATASTVSPPTNAAGLADAPSSLPTGSRFRSITPPHGRWRASYDRESGTLWVQTPQGHARTHYGAGQPTQALEPTIEQTAARIVTAPHETRRSTHFLAERTFRLRLGEGIVTGSMHSQTILALRIAHELATPEGFAAARQRLHTPPSAAGHPGSEPEVTLDPEVPWRLANLIRDPRGDPSTRDRVYEAEHEGWLGQLISEVIRDAAH
jgi:hypothetical protein